MKAFVAFITTFAVGTFFEVIGIIISRQYGLGVVPAVAVMCAFVVHSIEKAHVKVKSEVELDKYDKKKK